MKNLDLKQLETRIEKLETTNKMLINALLMIFSNMKHTEKTNPDYTMFMQTINTFIKEEK